MPEYSEATGHLVAQRATDVASCYLNFSISFQGLVPVQVTVPLLVGCKCLAPTYRNHDADDDDCERNGGRNDARLCILAVAGMMPGNLGRDIYENWRGRTSSGAGRPVSTRPPHTPPPPPPPPHPHTHPPPPHTRQPNPKRRRAGTRIYLYA